MNERGCKIYSNWVFGHLGNAKCTASIWHVFVKKVATKVLLSTSMAEAKLVFLSLDVTCLYHTHLPFTIYTL